nr:hypothetical protein [uncultured Flavobacterium sp.]
MKKKSLWLMALLMSASATFAQIKTTKIKNQNTVHYITTIINYPIAGLYAVQKQVEPITVLNADGTGMMQNEDLVKEPIVWGIECSESGIPIFKEGFDSAAYSFWYKKAKAPEEEWTYQSFTIHFNKMKMFIAGERFKEFTEEELKR